MSISLRLFRLTPADYDHARTTGRLSPGIDGENQEVDKDWGILERVLTGADPTDRPLAAQAINGGRRLTGEPGDYGGMRLLTPEEVTAIYETLRTFDDGEIERRCDTLDFTGVYGSEGDHPGSDAEDYVWAFHSLREFYRVASSKGQAIAVGKG